MTAHAPLETVTAFRSLQVGVLAISALFPACGEHSDSASSTATSSQTGATLSSAAMLQLVSEKKLSKLVSDSALNHFEASGVVASGGKLYVALDDATEIAAVDTSLGQGAFGPGKATESQYEGITATDDGRFYVMIETASADDLRGEIAELDATTALVSQAFTDTTFEHVNKGFEGIAWLRVAGTEYLLGLCEDNACKDDDTSPGEGRVKVMTLVDGTWTTQTTLNVPSAAAFLNYSDLALRDNGDGTFAAAIVSHKSSLLWTGTLTTAPWALTGPSTFYAFPRTSDGQIQYCSVEGVTYLGPNVLAFVSDKSDGDPCNDKAESVHVFQTPF